jgi:hypothetical protein
MRSTAVAVSLAATACASSFGCCSSPATDLRPIGTPARNAEFVIAAAQEECPRPLLGTIEWVTTPLPDGAVGWCRWNPCGLDVLVEWDADALGSTPFDATDSSLAHELGHWCLDTRSERAAEAWAIDVNARARDAMRAR